MAFSPRADRRRTRAAGALLGGYFGAHLAKRLPEWALRGVIVVVALAALLREVL